MPCIQYVELPGFASGHVIFQNKPDYAELQRLIRNVPELPRSIIMNQYSNDCTDAGYCVIALKGNYWHICVFDSTDNSTLTTLGHEAFHAADRLPYYGKDGKKSSDRMDELRADAAGIIVATAYAAYMRARQPVQQLHRLPTAPKPGGFIKAVARIALGHD